jgi:hypothetical protein
MNVPKICGNFRENVKFWKKNLNHFFQYLMGLHERCSCQVVSFKCMKITIGIFHPLFLLQSIDDELTNNVEC